MDRITTPGGIAKCFSAEGRKNRTPDESSYPEAEEVNTDSNPRTIQSGNSVTGIIFAPEKQADACGAHALPTSSCAQRLILALMSMRNCLGVWQSDCPAICSRANPIQHCFSRLPIPFLTHNALPEAGQTIGP
jgi:hypothetical protein